MNPDAVSPDSPKASVQNLIRDLIRADQMLFTPAGPDPEQAEQAARCEAERRGWGPEAVRQAGQDARAWAEDQRQAVRDFAGQMLRNPAGFTVPVPPRRG